MDPEEQRSGHDEHEWRADALEMADGFDPAPNDDHV